MLWDKFVQHQSIDEVVNDKGLAKTGDAIVNLCYSLAKSLVLDTTTGEKVRDRVLARAIRATPVYRHLGRRTDTGTAADGYEAIIAYLWMSGKVTLEDMVEYLVPLLKIDSKTSRKKEVDIAALAFQSLLETISIHLPQKDQ